MPPSQLQIKVKALERLMKEKELYSKDVKDEMLQLQEMNQKSFDTSEIKNQAKVLQESQKMVAEVDTRIVSHKRNLSEFLVNYDGDEDVNVAKNLLARCLD